MTHELVQGIHLRCKARSAALNARCTPAHALHPVCNSQPPTTCLHCQAPWPQGEMPTRCAAWQSRCPAGSGCARSRTLRRRRCKARPRLGAGCSRRCRWEGCPAGKAETRHRDQQGGGPTLRHSTTDHHMYCREAHRRRITAVVDLQVCRCSPKEPSWCGAMACPGTYTSIRK